MIDSGKEGGKAVHIFSLEWRIHRFAYLGCHIRNCFVYRC